MDPTTFEKNYGDFESAIAPMLKLLNEEKREPGREELEGLLTFMAIQWTRIPTFRPTVLGISDSFTRAEVGKSLASPESWQAALTAAGIPTDSPGSEYEKMREFQQAGEYKLTAETEWYLIEAFKAAEVIVPLLRARHWQTMISPSGSFVGSDNPVILDGSSKGEMVGFKNAEVVVYPISRWLMLWGTKDFYQQPRMTRKNIAFLNTLTMVAADEQIYSAARNFCWMDENRQYQTDWTLFDREKILSRTG